MHEKYDKIGKHYNRTRKADAFILERIFHHLGPKSSGVYLDIGCGTGNYTAGLSEKGLRLVGLDPSRKMLTTAKNAHNNVELMIGRAEKLPLKNNSVDGVVATLTTHHWKDLPGSFLEISRVLKSQRRFVIFTSTPDQMKGYWLNYYFPRMLEESGKMMTEVKRLKDLAETSGFDFVETERYFVRKDLEDMFLYSGKFRQLLYLDEDFRKGISSFSILGCGAEIEDGIRKLADDIETRRIDAVVRDYENDFGDYVFFVAQKRKEAK